MNLLKQPGAWLAISRLMYSWLFACGSKQSDCRENISHFIIHVILSYHLNQEISHWIKQTELMTPLNCSKVCVNSYGILLPLILLTTFLTGKKPQPVMQLEVTAPKWYVGKNWNQHFGEFFSLYKASRWVSQSKIRLLYYRKTLFS